MVGGGGMAGGEKNENRGCGEKNEKGEKKEKGKKRIFKE